MLALLKKFTEDEDAQDLVEYSLLLAGAGTSIKTVWTGINSTLTSAAS